MFLVLEWEMNKSKNLKRETLIFFSTSHIHPYFPVRLEKSGRGKSEVVKNVGICFPHSVEITCPFCKSFSALTAFPTVNISGVMLHSS